MKSVHLAEGALLANKVENGAERGVGTDTLRLPQPLRPPLLQSTCWATWSKPKAFPRPASRTQLRRRSLTRLGGSHLQLPRASVPPKNRRKSLEGGENPKPRNQSSRWSSLKTKSLQVRLVLGHWEGPEATPSVAWMRARKLSTEVISVNDLL